MGKERRTQRERSGASSILIPLYRFRRAKGGVSAEAGSGRRDGRGGRGGAVGCREEGRASAGPTRTPSSAAAAAQIANRGLREKVGALAQSGSCTEGGHEDGLSPSRSDCSCSIKASSRPSLGTFASHSGRPPRGRASEVHACPVEARQYLSREGEEAHSSALTTSSSRLSANRDTASTRTPHQ